ncbi:MAG: restriction endonuclease subunit S [Tissierellia bacterium]|nr:restriction endonuclease subunit S [Tissierellia bacterium]
MSRLDDLIQELCPDGVEFVEIEKVIISLKTGLNPRKFFKLNTIDAKNYYVTIREIRNNSIDFSKNTDRINDEALQLCNNRSNLEVGDVIFSGTGTIGQTAIIEKEPINWNIKEGVYALKPNFNIISSKYLSYVLQSSAIKVTIIKKSEGGTVKSISMRDLKCIKIPVPPIKVQSEIVKILDNFTELTAELTARKKQYEYYKANLLNLNGHCSMKELAEIAEYSKERIDASEVNESNYVGVDNLLQDKAGKVNSDYVPVSGRLIKYTTNSILVGNIRPYLRKIWLATNNGGTNGDVLVIQAKSGEVLPGYLYHQLSSERFFRHIIINSRGAKMPRGDKNEVMKFVIPIPTLDKQKEIVLQLDKFDILINDLSQGLPAEIEARQKQYEYYRDKLLSFKEKK